MLRCLKNQRGWVLIDCLTAAVIVAVALTALAGAYRQTVTASASAINYTRAVYLAQQELEGLKRYDNVEGGFTFSPQRTVTTTPDNVTYTIEVSRPDAPEIQSLIGLIPAEVKVSWHKQGQADGWITMTGYYYNIQIPGHIGGNGNGSGNG